MLKPVAVYGLSALLLCPGPALLAQPASEAERRYSLFSEPDIKPKDREQEVTLEAEFRTTIEIPGMEIIPCQAEVELAYSQRNTIAHVDAMVSNKQCDVVNGTFEIVASVRDDEGELTRHTFPESFSLESSQGLAFTRDYPIGENVTLSIVRTRRVECECLVDKTD